MNWVALIRMILELISKLQSNPAAQAIKWDVLIKYIPEIVDLVIRIIKDMNLGEGIQFANQQVANEFLANNPELEAQRIDWQKLISVLLPIIIELIGKKEA